MTYEVRRFDLSSGSDEVFRALHRMLVATWAIDRPGQDPPDFAAFVGRLHNPESGSGKPRHWLVMAGDRPVAWTFVHLPEVENQHLALGSTYLVAPEFRRRGIGTAMLRAIVAHLQAEGRAVLEFWTVVAGGVGERWATAQGFRVTQAMVLQELLVQQVDPALWAVAPPPRYRLVSWRRRCPDDLVESFARARTAITDAPPGDSAAENPQWTVDRVRLGEQQLVDRRIEARVCAAVARESGVVAGFTVVELHPHRRDQVYQNDTAVLAAHRGRGLGRCVKAAMTRSLVADLPDLRRVLTHTAATNKHMIATNHAVGYTDIRVQLVLTADLDALVNA